MILGIWWVTHNFPQLFWRCLRFLDFIVGCIADCIAANIDWFIVSYSVRKWLLVVLVLLLLIVLVVLLDIFLNTLYFGIWWVILNIPVICYPICVVWFDCHVVGNNAGHMGYIVGCSVGYIHAIVVVILLLLVVLVLLLAKFEKNILKYDGLY